MLQPHPASLAPAASPPIKPSSKLANNALSVLCLGLSVLDAEIVSQVTQELIACSAPISLLVEPSIVKFATTRTMEPHSTDVCLAMIRLIDPILENAINASTSQPKMNR